MRHNYEGKKINDWATPTLKEAPFWREGMEPEEYNVEREYYQRNFDSLVRKGKYKPLWKQREEADRFLSR